MFERVFSVAFFNIKPILLTDLQIPTHKPALEGPKPGPLVRGDRVSVLDLWQIYAY